MLHKIDACDCTLFFVEFGLWLAPKGNRGRRGPTEETALNWANQRTLVSGDRAQLGTIQEEFIDSINKRNNFESRILQALHMVKKSFASAKGDSDRFKLMYPYSTIAKGYQ